MYLDGPVLASSWYPAEDMIELLAALASTLDPKLFGSVGIYRYFGIVAAQRDIRGTQDLVDPESRTETAGIYRGVGVFSQSLASLIRRALLVARCTTGRAGTRPSASGSAPFASSSRSSPWSRTSSATIVTGYFIEVFRSAEIGARVDKVSCRAKGQAECAWELRIGPAVDVSELVVFE